MVNNLVTWSDTDRNLGTLSNNNLTYSTTSSSQGVRATYGKTSGKWYWEVKLDSGNANRIGVANKNYVISSTSLDNNVRGMYLATGSRQPEGTTYASSFTVGDVVGIALDMDNGTLTFYKNGILQGVSHNDLLSLGEVYPFIKPNANSTQTITANFGNSAFSYSVPTGYTSYIPPLNKILLSQNNKGYFFEESGSKDNIIPTMTSDTTPSGVASASSISSATYNAYKAFDKLYNSTANSWITTSNTKTGWLAYDFQKNIIISKYSIIVTSSWEALAPKDWTFEGSNDGINWTVLDTQAEQTGWIAGMKREFTLNNNTLYSKYRINVSANNGGGQLSISELEMFELEASSIVEITSISEQNLIKYGMDSPIQVDGIFTRKKYILQDVGSKDSDGLLKQQVNRKPLSIKFE